VPTEADWEKQHRQEGSSGKLAAAELRELD